MRKTAVLIVASASLLFSAPAFAGVEKGVLVIRGPGKAVAERSVERTVRVWRGERAAIVAGEELAGADTPKISAAKESTVVILRCGRGLNRLRTQGFYSGHPGGPSRRFTQGFYSGGPDYRRCVRVST